MLRVTPARRGPQRFEAVESRFSEPPESAFRRLEKPPKNLIYSTA
jgi:hypothetical protein